MYTRNWMILTCAVSLAVACGDDSSTGGNNNTGGSGGSPSSGGNPNTGGNPGNGGQPGTGGDPGNGGQPGNGGSPGTGGDPGTGGGVTAAQCTTECEEAVAGNCAPFGGDCATCCGAAADVPSCDAEATALYECFAGAATPCDADCAAESQAAQDCLFAYCTSGGGNLGQPPCSTLIGCK